jgi:hypothetical protein
MHGGIACVARAAIAMKTRGSRLAAPGLRRADGRPIGIANAMRVLKMGAAATSIEAPLRP